MRRSTLSIAFYVSLIFASGVAVGSLGQRLYNAKSVSAKAASRPDDYRQKYIKEMESRLKLTPTQVHSLSSILDETRSLYRSIKAKYEPEMHTVRDQQRGKVKAMLTDTQRAEYEKMLEEQRVKEATNANKGPGGI